MKYLFTVVIFSFTVAAPKITEIVEAYANGNPKIVKTYQENSRKMDLISENHYYGNGILNAEVLYRNSIVIKENYYDRSGKKVSQKIPLEENITNINLDIKKDFIDINSQLRNLNSKVSKLESEIAKLKVGSNSKKPKERPKSDPNKVYDIAIGNSMIQGDPNAPITIIEWMDYQ